MSNNNLRQQFSDRQLSSENYNKLRTGNFQAYYPSEDIRARFREIARDLGTYDVFITAAPILRRMQRDMNRLRLDGSFEKNIEPQTFAEGGIAKYEPNLEEVDQEGLDLNDYLFEDINIASLPQTPMPNPQVVQNPMQQASGVTATGLTPTENALLSEEEKQIVLRSRGLA